MKNEEIMAMKEHIYDGLKMVAEKAEKIGREKTEWSLDELGKMADIEKDMAKAFKCLIKTHIMLNEHSIEKY